MYSEFNIPSGADFFHQHYLHGLVHGETGFSTVNQQQDFNQKKMDINSVLVEQIQKTRYQSTVIWRLGLVVEPLFGNDPSHHNYCPFQTGGIPKLINHQPENYKLTSNH